MNTSNKISIGKAFTNYLKLNGFNRIPRTNTVTKKSVSAIVVGLVSVEHFTEVKRHPTLENCSIVRLRTSDFNNELITNGLFKYN